MSMLAAPPSLIVQSLPQMHGSPVCSFEKILDPENRDTDLIRLLSTLCQGNRRILVDVVNLVSSAFHRSSLFLYQALVEE